MLPKRKMSDWQQVGDELRERPGRMRPPVGARRLITSELCLLAKECYETRFTAIRHIFCLRCRAIPAITG